MNRKHPLLVLITLCLLLFPFPLSLSASQAPPASSIPTPPPPLPTPYYYYHSWLSSATHQLRSHFFPPNLDFRGGTSSDTADPSSIGGGTEVVEEKTKDAFAKSFGKTKSTVEDTAKSAAILAKDVMHETASKVKHSFSDESSSSTDAEL